jgi:hypothetical protein
VRQWRFTHEIVAVPSTACATVTLLRSARLLSLVCSLILWLSAGRAHATAPLDEPIDVRVQATASCTNASDFLERVRSRTPAARSPKWGEPARMFVVDAEVAFGRFRGHLLVHHLDGAESSRTLEGSSCDEVVDALALIVALDLDPQARTTPMTSFDSRAPELRSVEPPRTFASDAAPSAALQVPSEPWQLRAGAQFEVTSGILPVPLLGVPVVLELVRPSLERASPSFSLGFERTFNATLTSDSGDAVLGIVHGFALACPHAWRVGALRLGPCGRFEAGALLGRALLGKAVVSSTPAHRAWAAASVVGRASARLFSGVYLDLQLGIGVPVVGRFDLLLDPGVSLGRVGAWYWRSAVGLEVRFL